MKWKVEFICACGDCWRLTVPKKLRTKSFLNYALAEWNKKHGDHLSTTPKIKKL